MVEVRYRFEASKIEMEVAMVHTVAYLEASRLSSQAICFRWYSMALRDVVSKDSVGIKMEPCQAGSFASVKCAKRVLLTESDSITDLVPVCAQSAVPSIA